MSLLADLLSKNKAGSSPRDGEIPPRLTVPPTLSKTHAISSNVRSLNNRYVITIAVIAAFVALGTFAAIKFGTLSAPARKTTIVSPQATLQPIPARVGEPPAGEQVNKARITLEEPPVPVPQKNRPRHSTVLSSHHSGVVRAAHKPGAILPVGNKSERNPPVAAEPRQRAGSPSRIDTEKRDAFLYAARSAEQAGDLRTALANYRKAQKIDPDNYVIMNNAAAALNNLGMFDEGVQEAERALGKKPDYVPALINAAIGYSSQGNTQKALRHFTYASVLDPGNRSLIINLGILHERAGNLDAALATYRRLADDGDPLALQGMGRVYERKGNRLEAVRAYRQIMAQPTANAELKKDVKRKLVRLEE